MAGPLRYVVLHHTGWQADHFDMLMEVDAAGPLESWRLSHWPPCTGMTIRINTPHRRLYLDYEGPISGDRGRVDRVSAGTYVRQGRQVTFDSETLIFFPSEFES